MTDIKPCDAPCPKCGGLDIYRNYFARDQIITSEFDDTAPFPKHVYKTTGWREWAAVREFISNACRTCHFKWQSMPLKPPKKAKKQPQPGGDKP